MEHLKVSTAQRIVLESVTRLGSENITLERSLGRVLSENIHACRDLPPYDVSAMDGFAVRSSDLASSPVTLSIIEDIRAGDMPKQTVLPGQCSRIMTGAPVPAGADAVVPVEETQAVSTGTLSPNSLPRTGERDEVSLSESMFDAVQINHTVQSGNHVRPRGENMKLGELVLSSGTEITPGVIGVLATTKKSEMQVYRRPSVAILSTGDELEAMNAPVDPNKIPESNAYALMAQVQMLGIEPVLLGIARDDPVELEQYLLRGLDYDVLLVSGGTSVGVHDYVRPTIEKLNVTMKFWRVAMKPGHPLAFGVLKRSAQDALPPLLNPDETTSHLTKPSQNDSKVAGYLPLAGEGANDSLRELHVNAGTASDAFVFGLPGNPVSSMVCFEEFVAPALRAMMGHARLFRRTVTARLAHPVKIRPGRTEFIRVQLTQDETGYLASSTGTQSSGVLLLMARADGLLVMPAEGPALAAGEQVTVQLLDGMVFQDSAGFKE